MRHICLKSESLAGALLSCVDTGYAAKISVFVPAGMNCSSRPPMISDLIKKLSFVSALTSVS